MANEKRLDLIDRNKLKSEFEWLKSVVNESSKYEIQEHIQRIEDAPAVDAVELAYGAWVNVIHAVVDTTGYCTRCGEQAVWRTRNKPYAVCPNCGALMDGRSNVPKTDGDGSA